MGCVQLMWFAKAARELRMRGRNVCAMWFSHGCCYENVKQFSHQIGMYIEHNHIGSHIALPTVRVIAIRCQGTRQQYL